MASQIEHTLASLTALSEQYKAQLDSFFKSNDLSFHDFRSTTLANIKSAFRRIESNALASRSPVKSLRKKPRRKPKKATRTRRNKPRPDAQPRPVTGSARRTHVDNQISSPSFMSRPAPQPALRSSDPETAPEIPTNVSLPPSQRNVVKSPRSNHENNRKRKFASRRVSSKRATSSTASFQSAVESPIPRLTEDQTIDDRRQTEHPTKTLLHSPEIGESQWEDCRPKPEPVPLLRSKSSATSKGPGLERNLLEEEEAPIVDPNFGKSLPRENEASLISPRLSDIELQAPNDERSDALKNIHPLLDDELIDGKNRRETAIFEKESAKSLPSESEQLRETHSEEKEETPVLVRRRKRGARLAKVVSQPAQENGDSKRIGENSAIDLSLDDKVQRAKCAKQPGNSHHHRKSSENSGRKGYSSIEGIKDRSESAADGLHTDITNNTDFEFKAPKPRPLINNATSTSRPCTVGRADHRTNGIHQTPNAQNQRDAESNAPKQNVVLQKRFAVDEGGKINDAGIGLLSEIASTPATSSRGNEASGLKNGEERILRGTKLFKPTTDIYSAHRKPALSRVLSVQKSNTSSRDSILAHTPGVHAPTTRLASHALLTGPPNTSLRESLAALKQPITDSKHTQPKLDGEPNDEATWKTQSKSSIHHDEQATLTLADKKRLTFADGYKQVDGTRNQSARPLEPQTAPTKEFRQPRIRRDTEKSALRRRIEEIRGKASTSTVTNQASPRSSGDENLLGSSGQCDPESGNFEAKALDLGRHQTSLSPEHVRVCMTEREISSNVLKPPYQVGTGVLASDAALRDSPGSERVSAAGAEEEVSSTEEEPIPSDLASQRAPNSRVTSGMVGSHDLDNDKTGNEQEGETEGEASGPKTLLSNLMSSVSSLYPAASSLLGVRTNEERREETEAEVAAKRQRLDVERREAERLARMEAQRAARQKEAEDKQRRAEARRQLLAEAEKAKEDERKRKEEHRRKVKQEEEEQRKRKKLEEDRKKEERRRQVREKKAMNMELQSKRKAQDAKRQRLVKHVERGITGIPKPGALGGKMGKEGAVSGNLGKIISPISNSKQAEIELGRCGEEGGMASYVMTPAKETVIEGSDEETERRRDKEIPQWAGERDLAISTRSQPDPDKVFVNMPMCNLRDVFGTKKQYRTRSSSANWTQDRVTTSEMTKYKKAVGGFRDA